MPDPSQFNKDRTYPERWTITFRNPPINMFVPTTIIELAVHLVVFLGAGLEHGIHSEIVVRRVDVVAFVQSLHHVRRAKTPQVCWWLSSTAMADRSPLRRRTMQNSF
ncbi:MAG TPA: hypothetical protein VLW84_00465 [Terriglobales bacterium]|nr:hypothetical protein [Terriglobales bacterium]